MAVRLIRNGFLGGIVAGIQGARNVGSQNPADALYTNLAAVADAIATECMTKNAALTVPMADADNAEIGYLCLGAAAAATQQFFTNSATATDYAILAGQIVAAAKACVGKLVT